MLFDPGSGSVDDGAMSDGRRLCGRLPQDSLVTSLGPVIDLSVTGVRLVTRQNLKQVGQIVEVIVCDSTAGVKLQAKVVWQNKIGWFRREVGMAFIDTTPEDRQVLTQLATNNRRRRVIAG